MKRKRKSRVKRALLIFICTWVVFAQSCMKFRISDSDALAQFNQKGLSPGFHYVDVGALRLHYVKSGNDSLPTLVFVHGSPGSWDAFKMYMMDTALLAHYRMISIDRPGFGYSQFGKARRLDAQAVMLNKLMEKENNHRPVHLIGHSIGGPVIVQMAQDHPEAYASLTLLSGSISPADEPREYWRYAVMYSPFRWLLPGAFRPSNDEIVYFKKELKRLDTGYAVLQLPVTFIHGEADKFVTVKNVAYGRKKLVHNTQVKEIIIPGAGHFIPWDHYGTIKQHLLSLKDHR
ncbi:MAG: alpha/beta hydrolase [Chitinophagaceae bacterium]|nr:alpha/beta hydrolase [Chitinophagaceae bacterium]